MDAQLLAAVVVTKLSSRAGRNRMAGIDNTHMPSSLRDVERCGSIYMEILITRKTVYLAENYLRKPFLQFGFWIPIQNVKNVVPVSINKINNCIIVTGNGRSKIQSKNNLAIPSRLNTFLWYGTGILSDAEARIQIRTYLH